MSRAKAAGSGTTVLAGHGLHVGYPRRTLLRDLDVGLPAGRLTCLLGPNGTGKTTLLRTLTGMQPPIAGRIELTGHDLGELSALERARRLAVVLTGTVDVGLMHARDLVALGRYPRTGWGGRLRPHDHTVVDWALEVAGAARFADRAVATLSDGERQRVLIARALAQEPAVLALDEPTAFVDLPRRAELGDLLGHLAHECGLAVLMTTHDLDLAMRIADDVWLLEADDESSRMHEGGPEDLALSGAVSRAFASDEVVFDLSRGQFVPTLGPVTRATVVGDGPRAVWARRALERAGCGVAPDDRPAGSPDHAGTADTASNGDHQPIGITVHVLPDRWEVSSAGQTRSFPRLADLVEHVRALLLRLSGPVERVDS